MWESNPHNPKFPLHPHAWVRDLAAETMQVFLSWQSSSLEQTCHHQCPELILWMVTSMGRLRWGHPFHSISGTRTITTGQRGGRHFCMVASLNAAAKSDWAHESDVLLAWQQSNIWTAAYKESFLSILRAVWTELEYCSYFPLWFISLRYLRVRSDHAAKSQAWTNPLCTISDFWWEIPKQGKRVKRGQKLVLRTERKEKGR